MKKALLIVVLLVGALGYGQSKQAYLRLGKLTTTEIDAIDVTDTTVVYTAYDTTLGIEVKNTGSGWVPRITASGTIDATPTDGSNNAVASNGVFDALALKGGLASSNTWTATNIFTGNNTLEGVTTIGGTLGDKLRFKSEVGVNYVDQYNLNDSTFYIASPNGGSGFAYYWATDRYVLAGEVQFPSLSGSGAQMVVVDNNGTLGIQAIPGGGGGAVDSVNGQTGVVVLDADDIDDTTTTNKFVTAAHLTLLGNTSGSNSGDQTLSLGGTGNKDLTISSGNTVTLPTLANSDQNITATKTITIQPSQQLIIEESDGTPLARFYNTGATPYFEQGLRANGAPVYGPSWNGSNIVPNLDVIYDKIESISGGSTAATTTLTPFGDIGSTDVQAGMEEIVYDLGVDITANTADINTNAVDIAAIEAALNVVPASAISFNNQTSNYTLAATDANDNKIVRASYNDEDITLPSGIFDEGQAVKIAYAQTGTGDVNIIEGSGTSILGHTDGVTLSAYPSGLTLARISSATSPEVYEVIDSYGTLADYTAPAGCTPDPNEKYITANAASDLNCNESNATTGWTKFEDGSVINLESVADTDGDSTYSIKATITSAAAGAPSIRYLFAATAGDTFTVTVRAKKGQGDRVRLRDWQNCTGGPDNVDVTSSYVDYTYNITATATGNVEIRMVLWIFSGTPTVGDNGSISKVSVIKTN